MRYLILLFISTGAFGQLTPADEVSPFSNRADGYEFLQRARLNNSDEYLDGRTTIIEDSLDAYAIDFVTGDLDVTGTATIDTATITILNYTPPHAALNFSDSATVVALTQNIWVKMTGPNGAVFVVQEANGITAAGDTMTIVTDGDYEGHLALSFEGGPSDVFHVSLWINSVISTWEMHRKTSNNDTGNMGMPFYLAGLNAGDDVSVRIRNTGDNDDATLVSGQFIMKLSHPD